MSNLLDDVGGIVRRGPINNDDFNLAGRLCNDAVERRPMNAPKLYVGMQTDSRRLLMRTHAFAGEASERGTRHSRRAPAGAGSSYT